MRKKTLQINIPEPCDQKWSAMTPQGVDSRFCSECERTIVDYTNKTDREIVAAYKKSGGKLCGKFNKNQLNRDISLDTTTPSNKKLRMLGLMFTGLLATSSVNIKRSASRPIFKEQYSSYAIEETSKEKEASEKNQESDEDETINDKLNKEGECKVSDDKITTAETDFSCMVMGNLVPYPVERWDPINRINNWVHSTFTEKVNPVKEQDKSIQGYLRKKTEYISFDDDWSLDKIISEIHFNNINSLVTIDLNTRNEEHLTFIVADESGHQVFQQKRLITYYNNKILLDLKNSLNKKGTYFVSVLRGDQVLQTEIIYKAT